MTATGAFENSGFRGGVCACKAHGGRLKKRYKKQTDALADAANMPNDAYVYACPSEQRTWHVTGHPRPDGTYVKANKP